MRGFTGASLLDTVCDSMQLDDCEILLMQHAVATAGGLQRDEVRAPRLACYVSRCMTRVSRSLDNAFGGSVVLHSIDSGRVTVEQYISFVEEQM